MVSANRSNDANVVVNGILHRVQRYCILVTMHVHNWSGTPRIEGAEVTVGENVLDEDKTTVPCWRLFPKSYRQKFLSLETKARKLIKDASVPFNLKGVYIIPITAADSLFSSLRAIRDTYNQVTDDFINDYDNWLLKLKEDYGDKFKLVVKHIPSKVNLRNKFGIEWAIVPMGQPGATVDDYELSDLVVEAKQTMNKLIMESVENMIRQPREELVAAVSNVISHLRRDSSEKTGLRDASFDKLRRVFDKYRSFANIIDSNDKLLSLLKNADLQLEGVSINRINKDMEVRDGLVTILDELRKEADDEQRTLELFNKFKRNLDV